MKKKLFLINFSEEQICFIFKIKGMQKNAKKKLFLINGKNNQEYKEMHYSISFFGHQLAQTTRNLLFAL